MLPDHETFYARIEKNANKMYLKYGPEAEIKLAARISFLRAEMKMLEEYSQELDDK